MKRSSYFLAAALAGTLVAGCMSPQAARIQEKPALFASFSPKQQKLIEAGKVRAGFTTDMVYLALGNPSNLRQLTETELGRPPYSVLAAKGVTLIRGALGPVEEWTYDRYVPYPGQASFTLPSDPPIYRIGVGANGVVNQTDSGPYDNRAIGGAPDVCTLKVLVCDRRVVAAYLID